MGYIRVSLSEAPAHIYDIRLQFHQGGENKNIRVHFRKSSSSEKPLSKEHRTYPEELTPPATSENIYILMYFIADKTASKWFKKWYL